MTVKEIIREKSKKKEAGEDKLLNRAIADEKEGIKLYKRLIDQCDDPGEMKKYEEILADEKRHLKVLEGIKKSE